MSVIEQAVTLLETCWNERRAPLYAEVSALRAAMPKRRYEIACGQMLPVEPPATTAYCEGCMNAGDVITQGLHIVSKEYVASAERMGEQLGQCLAGELEWSPKLRAEIERELARREKP